MSLNCLSGFFFILNHLIIKGCKLPNLLLIVVCPEEGKVQQLGSLNPFQKEKTKRYWPKQVNIFTRLVCFVFYRDGVVISGHLSDRISACFISFFCKHRKKREKERKIEGKLVSNLRKVRLGFGHRSKEKTLRNQNSTSETCISFFRGRF